MVHQSFSESELEGHQHQTRQLFMGDDSLQISQSVERHSGWQWGVPWNWRSQQPAFISSGFFQWGAIAWQHEVIGGYVITPIKPFCINVRFSENALQKRQKNGRRLVIKFEVKSENMCECCCGLHGSKCSSLVSLKMCSFLYEIQLLWNDFRSVITIWSHLLIQSYWKFLCWLVHCCWWWIDINLGSLPSVFVTGSLWLQYAPSATSSDWKLLRLTVSASGWKWYYRTGQAKARWLAC